MYSLLVLFNEGVIIAEGCGVCKWITQVGVDILLDSGLGGVGFGPSEGGWLCSDDHCGSSRKKDEVTSADNVWLVKLGGNLTFGIHATYLKHIWFKVKIYALKYVEKNARNLKKVNLYIEMDKLWIKKRCRDPKEKSKFSYQKYANSSNEQKFVFYSGVRALIGFHIKTRARVEEELPDGHPEPVRRYYTEWICDHVNAPYACW